MKTFRYKHKKCMKRRGNVGSWPGKRKQETSKPPKRKTPKGKRKKKKVLNTSIDKVHEVYTL